MAQIAQEKIERVSRAIANEIRPQKIILFGSFVWGKVTKDSDFDLLIIKKTKKDKHKIQISLGRILFGKGIPVDTLIYTPEEIRKRLKLGDFFIRNIIEKGKILYEKK
ncbi:MAG: nucleotidyltransferase domain-containing protein [Patescibacteria group bacterium]|nr:nucleotidyltransferase domain-containing protein [Patescibacteria group bacterium]